jgi:pimeloyl-ACP methyl ester carboxylesterase
MRLAHHLDAFLIGRRRPDPRLWPESARLLRTAAGPIRALDTGGDKPVLLMAPDGPCVIEHYLPLLERLRHHYRVVCFDLPGFGFSFPRSDYRHELRQGAQAILAVMDALEIRRAVLSFSCVNGFYALAAASLAPERVARLVLTQTPDMQAMRDWTARIVPAAIRIPFLGQAANHLTRRRAAQGWFNVAVADRALRPQFHGPGDAALCNGGCWSLAGVVQGMLPTTPDEPLLRDVPVPATLLWGTRDRSHRPTDPESLRRHVPGLRIERVEVGHFADLEAPEVYSRLLIGQH